jgi:hypothetical protein
MSSQLDDFLQCNSDSELRELCIQFLRCDGNNTKLALHLESRSGASVTLEKVLLQNLVKINGPDNSFQWYEEPKMWEKRVTALAKAMQEEGYKPLPLIITNFWGEETIADGNHRHEAMLRLGMQEYWAVKFLI